jgi:hypothetical protein
MAKSKETDYLKALRDAEIREIKRYEKITNNPMTSDPDREHFIDLITKLKQKHAEEDYKSYQLKKLERGEASATKRKSKQDLINAEKARFGRNYFARDYISGMTDWTASAVIRKPFNRSGLRNELVSRGYTDISSGMPAADYKNKTGNLVKGRVKGTLDIGGVSGSLLKGKMTDALIPRKYAPGYNLGSGNTGIGSGNVIMPVGVLKIKKRGGKFNIYS